MTHARVPRAALEIDLDTKPIDVERFDTREKMLHAADIVERIYTKPLLCLMLYTLGTRHRAHATIIDELEKVSGDLDLEIPTFRDENFPIASDRVMREDARKNGFLRRISRVPTYVEMGDHVKPLPHYFVNPEHRAELLTCVVLAAHLLTREKSDTAPFLLQKRVEKENPGWLRNQTAILLEFLEKPDELRSADELETVTGHNSMRDMVNLMESLTRRGLIVPMGASLALTQKGLQYNENERIVTNMSATHRILLLTQTPVTYTREEFEQLIALRFYDGRIKGAKLRIATLLSLGLLHIQGDERVVRAVPYTTKSPFQYGESKEKTLFLTLREKIATQKEVTFDQAYETAKMMYGGNIMSALKALKSLERKGLLTRNFIPDIDRSMCKGDAQRQYSITKEGLDFIKQLVRLFGNPEIITGEKNLRKFFPAQNESISPREHIIRPSYTKHLVALIELLRPHLTTATEE